MKLKAFYLLVGVMVVPMLLAFATAPASAAAAGGGAMPWDTQLTTLQNALSGNTAKVIAIVAIFVAGMALVFGEDLGAFAKRLLMIVIAAAFLFAGASFLTTFAFNGGASI